MSTTTTRSSILRVFEHQTLLIGEEIDGCIFSKSHFNALSRFLGENGGKYFSLIHNGVKFSHYVGVIQIGMLTIEILPKADKAARPSTTLWHDVLMDMLKECRLLKVETLSSAHLQLRPNSILDLYFEIFLKEIEKLLRKGLFRKYREDEGNTNALRGKLIFHKNILKNFAHEERFYTRHEKFDYNHLLNQILRRALEVMEKLIFAPNLRLRIRRLKEHFPSSPKMNFKDHHFRIFAHDKKAKLYQNALEIARLLILNYSPDLRGGKHHLLAILFDMNLLFEEYVFRQLKKLEGKNLKVQRQTQKPFFQRRKIQLDILLTYFGKKYVLDTKWKILRKASPSIQDLKQMYIYNKYFNSERCLLVYPKVHDLNDLPPTPFQSPNELNEAEAKIDEIIFCQICFLEINHQFSKNKTIGQSILKKIRDY